MKHEKALLIKFISTLALLTIILGLFFDMAFSNIFLITLVLGIAAYLIGDLFTLPRTNNLFATLADFGLSFFIIWVMSINLTFGDGHVLMSLFAALGVSLFEYLFHRYLANNILSHTNESTRQRGILQYQTEVSEELTPVRPDVRTDDDSNN
ncbi:MAG: YndM family protein [Neobacillus sp.]